MQDKIEKASLCKTIDSQQKQQTTSKQKMKVPLKNTKGKNTTSMVDLHKGTRQESSNSARSLNKHITSSKEISQKEMLQQELNKFRREIEEKFSKSEANRNYVFPRNIEIESTVGSKEASCMININIVVKVIPASTLESIKKTCIAPKSRDQNYYSTFCNMKKPGSSQQRAESDERKTNSSSKLSNKILAQVNSTNSSKDINKEIGLKSIRKVLIKNINLQNRLNATKDLQKSKENAIKHEAVYSKSPVTYLKKKPHKLVKDKSTVSTKCVKAEGISKYFEVKKDFNTTLSIKHKQKRNKVVIVKSTSDLKDNSIKYISI